MNEEVQIFISYAREDQPRVEVLYQKLSAAGYQPWLDCQELQLGQGLESVIEQALQKSDLVLICLSATSINKRGFLQKEIKQALEHAQEKLEDDVWLIPARLDDCEVPVALSAIRWVDLFEDYGFDDLLRALEFQLKRIGKSAPPPLKPTPAPAPVVDRQPQADKERADEETLQRDTDGCVADRDQIPKYTWTDALKSRVVRFAKWAGWLTSLDQTLLDEYIHFQEQRVRKRVASYSRSF